MSVMRESVYFVECDYLLPGCVRMSLGTRWGRKAAYDLARETGWKCVEGKADMCANCVRVMEGA